MSKVIRFLRLDQLGEDAVDLDQCTRVAVPHVQNPLGLTKNTFDPMRVSVYYRTPDGRWISPMLGIRQPEGTGGYVEQYRWEIGEFMAESGYWPIPPELSQDPDQVLSGPSQMNLSPVLGAEPPQQAPGQTEENEDGLEAKTRAKKKDGDSELLIDATIDQLIETEEFWKTKPQIFEQARVSRSTGYHVFNESPSIRQKYDRYCQLRPVGKGPELNRKPNRKSKPRLDF
jgi:hypothetical protein